jgi:hypothetical protein
MLLLHMAHAAMTKCVHTSALEFQTVADRLKNIYEHLMVAQRSAIPGLKDTARCAAPQMLFNYPNCCRIDPHLPIALPRNT